MKIITFTILIVLCCQVVAQDQMPQNVKLLAKHTPEYFCQIGAQLITSYGTSYLAATGYNRSGICAELALDMAQQRNIMTDDAGIAVRQDYFANQQGICQFTVQGLRLGIDLGDLVDSFVALCHVYRPTAIDGNLAEIVAIEMMLDETKSID